MILPDPSGQYVVGADAGRDQIFVWKLDTNTGKLNQVSVTKTIPGFAPRHFAFSPDGKTLYQQGEQNSRLQVYGFADGKLTAEGRVHLDPAGGLSGRQHHLGASDRQGGQASLRRQPQSRLHRHHGGAGRRQRQADRQHPYRRQIPRSLTLDPNGKFLYSLNQAGDNLTTFRLDANGVPKFTGKFLGVGSPAVMEFLP